MKFHNILDEMLGNKTKVRLLRAFFTYPEKGFTESELERIAGIPQASVHRNVKSLLDNGLLDRKRIGKANLFSLNKEHVLYPLLNSNFKAERNLLAELKKMISEAVKSVAEVEIAVLFGSIIKGMERSDSDIDIFILCKGETSKLEDKLKDLTNISQKSERFPKRCHNGGRERELELSSCLIDPCRHQCMRCDLCQIFAITS